MKTEKISNSDKAFAYYQFIGMIPPDAKRFDWVMHHMDITLKDNDPERYKQFNIYDVIPVLRGQHTIIHKKDKPGFSPTEESKKKQSESMRGRKFTEEHKKKISESMKGNTNTVGKSWTLSDETKKKIGDSRRGKKCRLVDGKRVYYNA